MDTIWIVLATLVGAALAGLLGWMKTDMPWNTKRYLQSILSGVGAAIAFGTAYQFNSGSLQVYDILAAIAFGAGVDNVVNRAIGAIRK